MEHAEEKLRALMVGLQIDNMEHFLDNAKIGDYTHLGKAYFDTAVEWKEKSKENGKN